MGLRALTHASLATAYVVARPPTLILRAFHSARTLRTAVYDMEKVNTTQRLAELRKLMKQHQIDVYSVYPSGPYIFSTID
jgi:Xaa-Pro aminopeptidase